MPFDDSKLYQRMLSDFVSSRSTAGGRGGAPPNPAREAAERLGRALRKRTGTDVDLASMWTTEGGGQGTTTSGDGGATTVPAKKSKTTAKTTAAVVDRRASKGRKIRYAVVPKLVNFTFPVSRPEPTISEDVWFKSLFGGVGRSR